MNDRKVTVIQTTEKFPQLHKVGIYCRVSTNNADQLHSMATQASHLTRTVLCSPNWRLVDIYLDFHTGLEEQRPQLQRLLSDCKDGLIDTILVKSVSRFGRNTKELLCLLRSLKAMNIRVIFENEEIDTLKFETEFLITLLSAYSQEESYNRSENILWGIEKGMEDGTSKLYGRRCFGYQRNKDGLLEICPEEAETVRLIFSLYLKGYSIIAIIKELENRMILTPAGKKKWCNQSIVKILTNEKYIGNVLLKKTYTEGFPERKRKQNHGEKHRYLAEHVHPEIISKEVFEAVQVERARRSNVTTDENGVRKRAQKRYTSKSVKEEV